MALPVASKIALLTKEPDLDTSASAKRDPHTRPAPRLQAL